MRNVHLAHLLLALWLASCSSENQTAGGEDFPNSLETIGALAVEDLARSARLQTPSTPGVNTEPTITPDLPEAPPSPAPAPSIIPFAALASPPASSIFPPTYPAPVILQSDTTLDLADTATLGEALLVIATSGIGWVRRDSLLLRWDDQARDAIADNENLLRIAVYTELNDSTWTHEIATDADGDDIIGRLEAPPCRADYRKQSRWGQIESTSRSTVDGGPDCDFDTPADNNLLEAAHWSRWSGELVDSIAYADADGDGALTRADRDSSIIDITHWRSLLASSTQYTLTNLRLVSFADSLRNYPVRYREERLAGTTHTLTRLLGSDSTPQVALGDTVRVLEEHLQLPDSLPLGSASFWTQVDRAGSPASPIYRMRWQSPARSAQFPELTVEAWPEPALTRGTPFTQGRVAISALDDQETLWLLDLQADSTGFRGAARSGSREWDIDWDPRGARRR